MELDIQQVVQDAGQANEIGRNGSGPRRERPPRGGEWSESALRVLNERYLIKQNGKVVETPDEMCWRVACAIASAETRWVPAEKIREYEEAFYDVLIERKFMPNSPTLMNAGTGNGLQYSACYVLPVGDSISEIFDTLKHAAIIHKSGGGTGFAFSRVRRRDSLVATSGGRASGPVSFLRVYNAATEAVKQGGCVVPETMVTTQRGIVPIRELGPANAPADSWHQHAAPLIVATDDGPRASDEFYQHGVAPIRRIRTRSGYRLAATPEHRIRVIDEAGQYDWRHLRDLKPGDWAVLQKDHLLEPKDYSLEPLAAQPHPNATAVRLPMQASELLGEFIGYVVGDGSFNRYNRGGTTGRLILTVADNQPEVVEWLGRASQELFGLSPAARKKPGDASTNYFLNATTLVGWLHQLGVEKPSAATVRVPSAVFRKGRAMAAGFLRGLFTADGTVSREGYPSLCSASEALIDDVQQLLLALGIPSRVYITTTRTGAFGTTPLYRLYVTTRSGLGLFSHTVGFIDTRRRALLATALAAHAWEFNDVIPHQGKTLEAMYAGPGRGSGPMRGPRGADRQLYRAIQHYLPEVAAPRHRSRFRLAVLADRHEAIRNSSLSRFLADDQFYDPIDVIEEGEALTLDLSVPANNTYIANGFVSHNTRRGANMGILRVDHPDVLEFIDCKNDGGITNFNISVAVTDAFMAALHRDDFYDLVDPHSREVTNRLPAREVWEKIVDSAWRTGDPGLVFIDRINNSPANPTPEVGLIEATNPCGEQPLLPNEACNLGSLNLAKFVVEKDGRKDIDWAGLERAAKLCTRFLDDVIEANPYPLPEIDEMVKANRRIGLGVMGWADLLFELGISYDSDEAIRLADRMWSFVERVAHEESEALAEERGPFPNWHHSIYRDGKPLRNSTVTTIAPTGTISIIADASSGIEPIFALAFQHKVDDRKLTFVNPIFVDAAKRRGIYDDELMDRVSAQGSVHGLEGVPEDLQRVFVTAHEVEPEWHVRMQAAFQKHTDNGTSKTINLPNSATRADVEQAYNLAWDLGCLGITVFRDGCKGAQVLNIGIDEKKESHSPALAERATQASLPGLPAIRPRPGKLVGETHKIRTPVGTAYVTLNMDETGEPLEAFVNIGSSGSDVTAVAEALGRLISLVLRTPSPLTQREKVAEIVDQLRGIGGGRPLGFGAQRVLSLPDALGQVLSQYVEEEQEHVEAEPGRLLDGAPQGDICPSCGWAALVHEEGCKKCHFCGHSEC